MTYRIVNDPLDGHQYPEARHVDEQVLLFACWKRRWAITGGMELARVGIASELMSKVNRPRLWLCGLGAAR